MGLASAIIPAIITVVFAALTAGIAWVGFYTFNAAPIFGSMAVNYIAVILLAIWALGMAVYAVILLFATIVAALD